MPRGTRIEAPKYRPLYDTNMLQQTFQYRTADRTYVFNPKADGAVRLRIIDIFEGTIFNSTFSQAELERANITKLSAGDLENQIHQLAASELIYEEFVLDEKAEFDCKEALEQQIQEANFSVNEVPDFSLFSSENQKLFDTHYQSFKTFKEEKEYTEALEALAKALKYSKKADDYAVLPPLFEEMGEPEKARTAHLILAKAYLEEGNVEKALEGLASCPNVERIRFELLAQNGEKEKALELAKASLASWGSQYVDQDPPEPIIEFCKMLLASFPNKLDLYENIIHLFSLPEEKAHIALKGACHALVQGDLIQAEKFCVLAEDFQEGDILDRLLFFSVYEKRGDVAQLREKLEAFIARCSAIDFADPEIAVAYHILFQLDSPPHFEKAVETFRKLQEESNAKAGRKQVIWYAKWISSLIDEEKWEEADQRMGELSDAWEDNSGELEIYEMGVKIQRKQGERLELYLERLADAYKKYRFFEKEAQVRKELFQLSQDVYQAEKLGEALTQSGKSDEAVKVYFEGVVLSSLLSVNKDAYFRIFEQSILNLDPQLEHLDPTQRSHFLTQREIRDLTQKVENGDQERAALKEKLDQALEALTEVQTRLDLMESAKDALTSEMGKQQREAATQNAAKLAAERKARAEKVAAEKQEVERWLSDYGFTADDYQTRFKGIGNLGKIPPILANFYEVLNRQCPYFSKRQIKDTHFAVMIPEKLFGVAVSDSANLIKASRSAINFKNGSISEGNKIPNINPKDLSPGWILFPKFEIPNEQLQKSVASQRLPSYLEASFIALAFQLKFTSKYEGPSPFNLFNVTIATNHSRNASGSQVWRTAIRMSSITKSRTWYEITPTDMLEVKGSIKNVQDSSILNQGLDQIYIPITTI